MKVLIVSNMYPSEKEPVYGNFVKEQVEELRGLGIDCVLSVSTIKKGGKLRKIWKYLLLWFDMIKKVIKEKPDIIHIHYVFPTALILILLNIFIKKKIILTEHGSNLFRYKGIKAKLIKKIIDISKEMIVVSQYLKEKAIENYQIEEKKLHVIPCGVNTEKFYPIDKIESKRKLKLDVEKRIILFIGRLDEEKGIYTYLEIIKKIENENKEGSNQYIVIGDGPEKEKFAKEIKKLKSEIKMIGNINKNEVPIWFNASDVFIFPTKKEAFGLVALESLSCGTPVIANDIGGVSESVENEINGYLIEDNKVNDFIEKLELIFENEKKYHEFKEAGRKKALLFDTKRQTEKVKEIYKNIN